MADAYPWGTQSPAQRVSKLDTLLRANEKKRADAVEAHRRRILEIDEADKSLKSDMRVATAVVEKERREATAAAANRILEKVLGSTTADIDEAIRSGAFEKIILRTIEEASGKSRRTPARQAEGEPAATVAASAVPGVGERGASTGPSAGAEEAPLSAQSGPTAASPDDARSGDEVRPEDAVRTDGSV